MIERDDGPPARDTQRPSARWAFMGQSHTELEDRLLSKIDAERAVERLQGDPADEVSREVRAWARETLGRLRNGAAL